jgi:hypothetical protein
MARQNKREDARMIRSILNKAKSAMVDWIVKLGYTPTDEELRAWQSGYIAGLNQKESN